MLITFEDMVNLSLIGDDENGITRYKTLFEDCTKAEMKSLIDLDNFYFAAYGVHVIVNYDELKKAYEAAK